VKSPGPGTIGQRQLCCSRTVNINPRLADSAGGNFPAVSIEMPAGCNLVVAVTDAAGLASRKRQKRLIIKGDLLTFLIKQIDAVNEIGTAAIALVAD